MKDINKIIRTLKRGCEEIISEEELKKKLISSEKSNKPLRIKCGIDPTNKDIHIGHLVPFRKMRMFQDLGHIGVVIIGDYTAQIGDPTGLDSARPSLGFEEVKENSKYFMEQLYTVLDKDKTEVRHQTEWFDKISLQDIIKLMGKFTFAQIMAHETFKLRYEKGLPLSMHEILYPILQAYDSAMVKADVELGATEQKFNILMGRDMQRSVSQEPQVVMLGPILMGLDGVNKMSKSLNNYVGINDVPNDKYGKTMSIPDSLIVNFFEHATNVSLEELESIKKKLSDKSQNPMELKKLLARTIVEDFHSKEEADKAEKNFETIHSKKEIPDDIKEIKIGVSDLKCRVRVVKLLKDKLNAVSSNGEARRLISQGGVKINDQKVDDPNAEVEITDNMVVKVGKRGFCRVRVER
jgi:tyrosyl-tRNA synthetase